MKVLLLGGQSDGETVEVDKQHTIVMRNQLVGEEYTDKPSVNRPVYYKDEIYLVYKLSDEFAVATLQNWKDDPIELLVAGYRRGIKRL